MSGTAAQPSNAQRLASIRAIARAHEAIRIRFIDIACPLMHPSELDDETRRLVAWCGLAA